MSRRMLTFKFEESYISALDEMQKRYGATRAAVVRRAIRLLYKRFKNSRKNRKKP